MHEFGFIIRILLFLECEFRCWWCQCQVGNFRVEPPGLFRGRGEHPKVIVTSFLKHKSFLCHGYFWHLCYFLMHFKSKRLLFFLVGYFMYQMGKLKKRIQPSDITINIGKDASIPECPIPGERFCFCWYFSWGKGKGEIFDISEIQIFSNSFVQIFITLEIFYLGSWKEVKHDNTVTWLAFWNDPINPKEFKYVFLAASSSLKGQSDKEKYEKARKLKVLPICFW